MSRISDDEQCAFELWLERESPSGDAEQVQRLWLTSYDYMDFYAPACERCKGSGEDPEGFLSHGRGPADETVDGPCRECSGTGAAPRGNWKAT